MVERTREPSRGSGVLEVSVDSVKEWWALKERLVYTLGRTSARDATPEIRMVCEELLAKLAEAKGTNQ